MSAPQTDVVESIQIRLLIDCPWLGLTQETPITLIPKPRYSRGEVVIVETITKKTILCAYLLQRETECFFFIPCPMKSNVLKSVHFFSAHLKSLSILGSVRECAHLRLLIPVPDD